MIFDEGKTKTTISNNLNYNDDTPTFFTNAFAIKEKEYGSIFKSDRFIARIQSDIADEKIMGLRCVFVQYFLIATSMCIYVNLLQRSFGPTFLPSVF